MNNSYEVEVLVNDNPIKQHQYNGKFYIEAKEYTQYSLKIKNNTWNKALVLTSVDGLDTLSGQTASNNSGGYIIEGKSVFIIKGYRKDLNSVGAFKFVPKSKSYAKSKGNNAEINCGIIGVRIFEQKRVTPPIIIKEEEYIPYPVEKPVPYLIDPISPWKNPWERPWDWYPIWTTSSTPYFGDPPGACGGLSSYMMGTATSCNLSYSNNQDTFNLGSTWGNKIESIVSETVFERGNLVFSQDIYYSTRENLIKMGVPIIKQPKISYPQSFSKKFAEPPVDWH